MKLSTRLLLMLLAVALLPMLLLGAIGLDNNRHTIQQEQFNMLRTLVELHLHHIQDVVHERRLDIEALQNSFNIRKNLPILQEQMSRPDSPAYRKATALLDAQLQEICRDAAYDNILLLDTHGRLAYATDDSLIDQHIGKPLPAPFDGVFAAAAKGLYFSPVFSGRTPERNRMHLLMAAPLKDVAGHAIGVIVIQMDMESLYHHMTHMEGLGKTGEILLGVRSGDSIKFISPVRHSHGGAFLQVPWRSTDAQPMRLALEGKSGSGFSVDYRGQEVLAAWQPVPKLGWGMVVKVDASEAFDSIYHLQKLGMVAMALTALLSLGLAFAASRAITLPIRRLQKASRLIGEGNLDYKVGSKQRDEIGELARSMDEMADRLNQAREGRQELINILDMTPDFVAVCDADGSIRYLNRGGRRLVGLGDGADISGINVLQFYSEAAGKEVLDEGIPTAIRDGQWVHETAVLAPDGGGIPVSKVLLAHKDRDGNVKYLSTIMRDLRELRGLESRVAESRGELLALNRNLQEQVRNNTEINRKLEQRIAEDEKTREAMLIMMEDLNGLNVEIEQGKREWEATFDAVAHPIFLHDKAGKIIRVNKAYAEKAGIPPARLIGRPYWQVFPKQENRPGYCCLQPETRGIELAEGKTHYRLYMYPVYDQEGDFRFSVHFMQDITLRKRAQMALQESQQRYSRLFEAVTDAVFVTEIREDGSSGRIIEVNGQACRQTGHTREVLLGMSLGNLNASTDQDLKSVFRDLLDGKSVRYEMMQVVRDHEPIPVEIQAQSFSFGDRQVAIYLVRDISDRVHSELELEHANRALMAISEVNRQLVYAEDEVDLMQAICRTIQQMPAYRMAWVGYVQHDETKSIRVTASAGVGEECFAKFVPGWGDDERGSGPCGKAVKTGKTQMVRDVASEPVFPPWREALLEMGCRSVLSLPLPTDTGEIFGVLNVFSVDVDGFPDKELALLEEMAGDLAFGVRVLRARLERDQALKLNARHLAEIHHNLEETIMAISKAVEARDPYTAGHQLRVAELACAIGRQMGLDENVLEGIRMGGVIHDIGKIQTPAEILSKPARLSDIEYMIIKEHPRIGYEILKEIHFPWPVAEIAYQHHERVDGTGYPQGLTGDQMCLEARIVAVADVVEAMTSHRPYRPGLGVDVAKAEIVKNRGKFYDPVAVDACIKVLDEGFEWTAT